jgi:hypothetical protein
MRRVLLLGAGIAAVLAIASLSRLVATELPIHRDLNRPSRFSSWARAWQPAIPKDAIDSKTWSVGEGTDEMFTEGWARHHRWDTAVSFKLVAGAEDRLIPALVASLRKFASADSCQAESLWFVDWQAGRDFLHTRYETRARRGEVFAWSAHAPGALSQNDHSRVTNPLPSGCDHTIHVRLTEEPNSQEELRRIGAKKR